MARSTGKNRWVSSVFSSMSPHYDRMHRLLTLGMDGRMRVAAARQLRGGTGEKLLDLCTGTGAMLLAIRRRRPDLFLTGVDICDEMIGLAREKLSSVDRVELSHANAEDLPFRDGQFGFVTCAFACPHVSDIRAMLYQAYRVMKKKGKIVLVDNTRPAGPLALFFMIYQRLLYPLLAPQAEDRWLYRYLSDSLRYFPHPNKIKMTMQELGFIRVKYRWLGLGMACVWVGEKE